MLSRTKIRRETLLWFNLTRPELVQMGWNHSCSNPQGRKTYVVLHWAIQIFHAVPVRMDTLHCHNIRVVTESLKDNCWNQRQDKAKGQETVQTQDHAIKTGCVGSRLLKPGFRSYQLLLEMWALFWIKSSQIMFFVIYFDFLCLQHSY